MQACGVLSTVMHRAAKGVAEVLEGSNLRVARLGAETLLATNENPVDCWLVQDCADDVGLLESRTP
jgi:hypothetical protein